MQNVSYLNVTNIPDCDEQLWYDSPRQFCQE